MYLCNSRKMSFNIEIYLVRIGMVTQKIYMDMKSESNEMKMLAGLWD